MSLSFATRIPVCTTAAKMLERCLLPCHGGAGSTVIEGTVNERADVTVNGAPAMLRAVTAASKVL